MINKYLRDIAFIFQYSLVIEEKISANGEKNNWLFLNLNQRNLTLHLIYIFSSILTCIKTSEPF